MEEYKKIVSNFFKKYRLMLLIFVVGFGMGVGAYKIILCKNNIYETKQVRNQSGYKFINPLYECEVGNIEMLKKYIPFEEKIKARIQSEIPQEKIQLAYYFRNLNNGPWFGMNEDVSYAPASLLKVPIMMAYFRLADQDPKILKQELMFIPDQEESQLPVHQIQSGQPLDPEEKYTVEELIEKMIIYSDNNAMALLVENIPQEKLDEAYAELGVKNPYDQSEDDVITVKEYASFFRILYNSAYLDHEYSEKALKLLSRCSFKGGIPSGVPESITVAHKFGERELAEGEMKQQFHDCGVVYYEKYPYLLCVMTRGMDQKELIEAIRNVSRITFEEIKKTYP